MVTIEINLKGIENKAERARLEKWVAEEINGQKYTQKEINSLIYLTRKGKKEAAWKILFKGHKCPVDCQHCQIINSIHQILDNKQKTKEEKVQALISFCLDHLNQGVKEEWQKRRTKAELLTILAEHETKILKQEIFKDYVDKEIIKKMGF